MSADTDRRTALYRLYGADDALLYVGITYDPPTRFASHRQEKWWWPEVARKEIVWYDTRSEADIAEATAIRTEMPRENKALPDENNVFRRGVGRRKWTPDESTEQGLSELVDLRKRADELDANLRAELARLAQPTGPVPIAYLAERLGIERKTIYRHLGRSRT